MTFSADSRREHLLTSLLSIVTAVAVIVLTFTR